MVHSFVQKYIKYAILTLAFKNIYFSFLSRTRLFVIGPVIFAVIFNEKWLLNKHFTNEKILHLIWFDLFSLELGGHKPIVCPAAWYLSESFIAERDTHLLCSLTTRGCKEYSSCLALLSLLGTRMSASWVEQTGPLSDHSCLCTVNVFPSSRGSQSGLIATEPSVIQECNYLLTQIIYLAGSLYPSHRAANTCQ